MTLSVWLSPVTEVKPLVVFPTLTFLSREAPLCKTQTEEWERTVQAGTRVELSVVLF